MQGSACMRHLAAETQPGAEGRHACSRDADDAVCPSAGGKRAGRVHTQLPGAGARTGEPGVERQSITRVCVTRSPPAWLLAVVKSRG